MVTIIVRAEDLEQVLGDALSHEVYWECKISETHKRVRRAFYAAAPHLQPEGAEW